MTAEAGYTSGPFRIVPSRQELLREGEPVPLGGRAFDVLRALVERAGELVTKQQLFAAVWPGTVVEESNLTVAISAVRRALGCGVDGKRYIATVTGRGYRFVAPVTREAALPVVLPTVPESGNLPAAVAPLIGRERDLEIVRDMLGRARLVSLLGAGGVGKTRLALAVGHAALGDWPDGVWLVELAPLTSPELVVEAAAAALGLAVTDHRSAAALVAAYLRKRKALLILDNCEHLVEAAARFAATLLAACPEVSILATSREAVKVTGEQTYLVPSLSVPAEAESATADQALRHGAVQLFVERAAAAVDGYRLRDGDAPVVAEICRRVDGIALAIELAAPRLRMIGPGEVLARLEDRFSLLTGGSRAALPRHQTLRALIDWSYDLLAEDERALLRRLSVFIGGFTLDAAVAVASGMAEARTVFDLLASLVDKSLVVADVAEDGTRYRLLDSTRRYAAERLEAAGEADVAALHARYMATLLAGAEAVYETQSSGAWQAPYLPELDNLRAALGWAFGPGGDPDLGVEIVAYSRQLWAELGLPAELRRWVDIASPHLHPGIAPGIVLRLLFSRGHRPVYGMQSATADLREALALARQSGEPALIARALSLVALNDLRPETARQAMVTLAEAIDAVRPLGMSRSLASLMGRLGLAADLAGETATARRCFEEAISLARSTGNTRTLVSLRTNLAELMFAQGEVEPAIAIARDTVEIARRAGLKVNQCQTGINLGAYLLVHGDTEDAVPLLLSALALARSLDEEFLAMSAVQHLALALARGGEPRTAALLLGRVDAIYRAEANVRESTEQATLELLRAALATALPEPERAALLAEGAALSLDATLEAASRAG